MYLSIVVPLYNEEESVQRLYSSIIDAVSPEDYEFEIIFVDDGSKDRTFDIAAGIAARDPRLRVIEFRKNYGQTPAMAAGIDLAHGEIIVTMDGDLQNDPGDIPEFVTTMNEGYDIVVGWRFNRKDKLISRKIPSKIANWLIGRVTGVPIKDNGCSLKAYRAGLIKRVPLYNEMHRFIPAMTSITGARIAEIKVRHHARQFGQSKYGLSRTYKVLLDLLSVKTIVGFAQRPMIWFGLLSMPFFVLALLAIAFALVPLMTAGDPIVVTFAGTGLLFAAIGIVLVLGGAVGELIFSTGRVNLPRHRAPMVAHRVVDLRNGPSTREKSKPVTVQNVRT
jgi:glycosyltransferase involved in cell wall biosynthesis